MDTVEESNDHIYIGGRKIVKKVTGTVKLGNKKYKVVKGVVKAIDIQPLLGHSNLAMTQHYIGQRTTERDSTEMARILA